MNAPRLATLPRLFSGNARRLIPDNHAATYSSLDARPYPLLPNACGHQTLLRMTCLAVGTARTQEICAHNCRAPQGPVRLILPEDA